LPWLAWNWNHLKPQSWFVPWVARIAYVSYCVWLVFLNRVLFFFLKQWFFR
jgi:hypothetical protein